MEDDLSPQPNDLTGRTVNVAFEVWWRLGPGLSESLYQEAFAIEAAHQGLPVVFQQAVPVLYRGHPLARLKYVDVLVEDQVVVELKAVLDLHPSHFAQLRTYLRLTGAPVGLLINFHPARFREGVHRLANTRPPLRRSKLCGSAALRAGSANPGDAGKSDVD